MTFHTKLVTLPAWLAYLEKLHPKMIDYNLVRVNQVANRLNCTQFPCPVITIAGTNGKGSTAKVVETIALKAKLTVGLYSSPHFLLFNERIRINGVEIDDASLCQAFQRVEQAREDITLTYYEFTTLAALLLFQQATLDLLVLEVGMGGRLDAVNIVDPDVSVITSVALDHERYLGETVEAIATEKAGIMRAAKPVIFAARDIPDAIVARANQLQAPLYQYGQHYQFKKTKTGWIWQNDKLTSLELPHTKLAFINCAAAIQALLLLPAFAIAREAISAGIACASLPGRCQVVSTKPMIVLDVAHNPHAAKWLNQQLQQYHHIKNWHAIIGMMDDKAISATCQELLPLVNSWQVVSLPTERAASVDRLQNALYQLDISNIQIAKCVQSAIDNMKLSIRHDEGILVMGSFYTVAACYNGHNSWGFYDKK